MDETMEFEYLALIANYPKLFDINILKEEYFEGKDKVMFRILKEEYELHSSFIIENLSHHDDFDVDYFFDLHEGNLYNHGKETKFEELQKGIIDKYKKRKYKEIIDSYNGNYEENLIELNKLSEINYQENNYVTSEDIIKTLRDKRKQVKLGYQILDNNLNLSQNDLLIVSAGTGVGKSTFALNLLYNLSEEYQCIYFNMEMSKNILYKRLISLSTKIPIMELNNINELDNDTKQLVVNKAREIEQRNIILINGSLKINELKKNIVNIKTDKPIIVFLDHIGLIKSSGNSLYEKMTNVAKALRTLCLECNCTIIGLCQLSRESQKTNEKPKLTDLRDSGEVEQSARKVLMIYDKDKGKDERYHNIEIIIAKNDDGRVTNRTFKFDRYLQRFEEDLFK